MDIPSEQWVWGTFQRPPATCATRGPTREQVPARVRPEDARAAVRLLGECRDAAGDFDGWHGRLQAGLARLVGADMGVGAAAAAVSPDGRVAVSRTVVAGIADPAAAAAWSAFSQAGGHNRDPVVLRLAAAGRRLRTWTRGRRSATGSGTGPRRSPGCAGRSASTGA